MQKISFSEKPPIITSLLVTLLFMVVISIGGAIASIGNIDSKITLLIAYILVASFLVFLIQRKKYWSCLGFSQSGRRGWRSYLLYIPLFVIAILPIVVGFSADLLWTDILYIIVFMAIVAFVEETIFRGIIVQLLRKKSILLAILGSSFLFSIPHILNALNGKDLGQTILQIVFAFVIGIILAMLILKTGNIIPLIAYHFVNNTITSISNSNVDETVTLDLTLAITLIGVLYMVWLYVATYSAKAKLSSKN